MKTTRTLALAALLTAATFTASAQTVPDPLQLNDIKTPISPAFVVLGVAPTDVARPTTPRAVGIALISANSDSGGGGLPRNLALEVAPYWLSNRPALTFAQYDHPSFWQSLQQTLSVSVATKNGTPANSAGTTNVPSSLGALGIRASWTIGASSALEQQVLAAYHAKAKTFLLQPTRPTDAEVSVALRPFVMAMREAMKQGRWIVEAAAASSAMFPNNNLDQAETQKNAIWLTPSYRFERGTFNPATGMLTEAPSIDFMTVLRYSEDRTVTVVTGRNSIDAGARLLWESDTIAVSAEHLERFGDGKHTRRTSILGEYKLTDNLYVSATFGRNFAGENPNGNLIALFGINFNAGQKPSMLPPAP
jgi:hypothetical protein